MAEQAILDSEETHSGKFISEQGPFEMSAGTHYRCLGAFTTG